MKTPYGDDCIAFEKTERMGKLVIDQARGSWQRSVCQSLLRDGYIIGYQATGSSLRGKARKYQSKYQTSLHNLMDRVTQVILDESPYCLIHGRVGPKGAYGYYITTTAVRKD